MYPTPRIEQNNSDGTQLFDAATAQAHHDYHSQGLITYGELKDREEWAAVERGRLALAEEEAVDRQTGRKVTPKMKLKRWVMRHIVS